MTSRSTIGTISVKWGILLFLYLFSAVKYPSEHKWLCLTFLANIFSSVLKHISRQKHSTLAIKMSEANELRSEMCRQEFNWGAEVWPQVDRQKHFCSRSQSSTCAPERAGVQMHLSHLVWGYFRLSFQDGCLLHIVPLVENLWSSCFKLQFLSWVQWQ